MARRIFISFQRRDRDRAAGFNLLRWNKNVDFEFVGRHLLSPVDSEDPDYIRRMIGEQMHGTSITVVLIGKETVDSGWVAHEIERSLADGKGLLGIRLEPGVAVPQALADSGAEIIDWDPHAFEDAIERAFVAAGRTDAIKRVAGTGGSCAR
jgi:antiphage defense system Thoeris ThsB-like protein